VTGRYETAHPHNLALVALAARLVQGQLRTEMLERDARILGLFADHTARHGGPAAAVSRSGRVLAATPAQWTGGRIELGANGAAEGGEVRLADGTGASLHPLGDGELIRPLGPDAGSRRFPALRLQLLGRDRVELHRLRAILGEALRTRPYRLDGVSSDLADLRRCLDEGRPEAALSSTAARCCPDPPCRRS